MYENRGFTSPAEPLSIGNVVSAAVRLYRSHLKSYLRIAFTAHLWALVPIYGWAKYAASSGLISRLAFGELTNQPESVEDARSHVNPRLWSFWGIYFRVGIYVVLVYLGLAIAGGITVGVLAAVLNTVLGRAGAIITTALVAILMVIILVMGLTWFYARWVIAEVPLAVEENINGSESVKRSWELTKASAFRIQGVVIVAGLVTLPIVFLFNYLPSLFLLPLDPGSSIYWLVYAIAMVISLVGGMFVMPFWQSMKAVLYYDLRSRREGLGLELRNREI
ncbi:glycerophosphoryl diester phosphodiesterase membrane domain-containing protein [Anabaena azotica]|uniref:glycerophosphoryl diester phosphodiesterase membrane domain-containing protein n=1 Tax=Anabaena azotica TaxID=197653 RepID=UPI0039A73579